MRRSLPLSQKEFVMRRSTWFVVIGAALALLAGQAAFAQASQPSSQQEKMTTCSADAKAKGLMRSEEHTSELQSRLHLVCRLLLEKKKRFFAGRHAISI